MPSPQQKVKVPVFLVNLDVLPHWMDAVQASFSSSMANHSPGPSARHT